MNWPFSNRTLLSLLVGIGLVLTGLLAGILLMLVVVDGPRSVGEGQPTVRPVELGKRAPALAPESTIALSPTDILALNRPFQNVAEQVKPTVVFIEVEIGAREEGEWFHNFNFRDRAPRQSVGSGVVISEEGYIVTNQHVVSGAEAIRVTLADKRQYEAHVVGMDASTDLAVIQVETDEPLPVVQLGDSDALTVGEWVIAIGNPFRLTSTVTSGIISALGRQVNIIDDNFSIEDFIQTDAAINPGNSGGALVNLSGELIGINTAIATETGSNEGYGFAVPVNLVERVAADLIAYGEVQRGFLGVQIQPVDAAMARQLGLERVRGVYVYSAQRGGAAYQGGMREGDIVLAIDGIDVNEPNELQSVVARRRPGDQLAVEVWRRGVSRLFNVRLMGRDDPAYETWVAEELVEPEAMPPGLPEPDGEDEQADAPILEVDPWGLGVRDLTPRERDAFDVEQGAYIAFVENAGPAFLAGVPRDAVILAIGPASVTSAGEVPGQLEQLVDRREGTTVVRVKRRDGTLSFFEIEVPRR